MERNNDDNILLNSYLDTVLFNKNNNNFVDSVELIIRPECNQKCEYCYIYKYGNKLYPLQERVDNNTLLKNITILFDYFFKKEVFLNKLELFAGDLFYDNLFFNLIEIIYNYYNKFYQINPNIFYENHNVIIIPCNFSFCEDKIKIQKFKENFLKFKEINVRLFLSYSSDGLYASNIREKKDLSEEFIDNVFTLMYDCEFFNGSHPMISYESIDNAIENYEWWKSQYLKYNKKYNRPEGKDILTPMLEVRNEGWTEESIKKYIEFLNYMIEDRLQICNNDIHIFTKNIFKINDQIGPAVLDPLSIHFFSSETNMSCNLGNSICIQCNNLTLVPCHRLSYPFFQGGKFIIENDKIKTIESLEGLDGYLNLSLRNKLLSPICSFCDYKDICLKGCCGAQFEALGEPNLPIIEICNLYKAKNNFLFKKYNELGVFKEAIQNKWLSNEYVKIIQNILNLTGEVLNG